MDTHYKWIALSNTTLGLLMATINSSIVLIALPDIFRGIGIDPLGPGNTSYLLWMIMGFLVVTAVLVVGFGRLGDMYGRVRMYNLGFVVFTVASILLAVTWQQGEAAALWLIGWRIVQGIGGAFIMANSTAILTDAFPADQRGTALGINGVAAIAGSFLGLVIGGLLGPLNWHLVFLVSVPFGVFGTVWAYLKLRDTGERRPAKMDWWGNITFAVGLIALLVGITYGIQPYGDSTMGWGSPLVLTCVIGGVVVLVAFAVIESRVANPLFTLSLFRIRAFTLGNIAILLSSLGRGGLQFILIIWLQGIWLPQHGYSFEQTPLWAGIYMLPLTLGFLVSAPASGYLSDRFGARWFSAGGMVLTAVSFVLLEALPIDFDYWAFAAVLLVSGIGMGLFTSPEPRGDHEQPARELPRGRGGHERHVPERGHGALDRRVLQPDDRRALAEPAVGAGAGPRGARRARRGRRARGRAAAGRRAVRGVPRLQPDPAAARPDPVGPARRPGHVPHRPQLLPAADLGPVRRRPDGRVLVRHRRVRRRRRRLVVRLRAQPRPPARVGRRRAGREQRRAGDRRDAPRTRGGPAHGRRAHGQRLDRSRLGRHRHRRAWAPNAAGRWPPPTGTTPSAGSTPASTPWWPARRASGRPSPPSPGAARAPPTTSRSTGTAASAASSTTAPRRSRTPW